MTRSAEHSNANAAEAYVRSNAVRSVRGLQEFIHFPSVNSELRRADDVLRFASWLEAHMCRVGLTHVSVFMPARHLTVYGEWLRAIGRPTILIYGYYDAQPAEPLKDWKHPSFTAEIDDGFLHGRGAGDDRGQLFAHVKAIEALLKIRGRLPVNMKCLFKGEEEIGVPNLPAFRASNRDTFTADTAVMSDTRMLGPDQPALTYSLQGQLALEIEVRGPSRDLHSGNFGGAIHNPLQALSKIIAQLHDENRRVAILGFYDRVRRSSEVERVYMRRNGPPDKQILLDAQINAGWEEYGYSLYERVTVRPSLTINSISGGYQGVGGKAVIPSRALAKLSFRLVPGQDLHEIDILFRRHIARITPPAVKCLVRTNQCANPAVIDRRHPALHAAAAAYHKAFGRMPVFLRSSGSIPLVTMFQQVLAIPTVLMGFALPDDHIHAPNEKLHLPNFYKGIEATVWFLWEISHQFHGREYLPALYTQATEAMEVNQL